MTVFRFGVFVAILAASACFAPGASALVLYDNFAGTPQTTVGIGTADFGGVQFSSIASQFTTGRNAVTLTSLDVVLSGRTNGVTPGAANVVFGLYANNANNDPSALLFDFGTQSVPTTAPAAIFAFAPRTTFTLAPGTTYNVVGTTFDGTAAAWTVNDLIPTEQNGSGIVFNAESSSQNFNNGGEGTFNDTPGVARFTIRLNGTVVPEAGTLALVLPVLLGGTGIALRRKR
ncbi:MAG: hypothetical protein H7Y38_14730 [Armatimonadetes bacterium]|nr:hypothetical protein [Armatimonadota bacterium]